MFGMWRRLADLPGWLRVLLAGQFISAAGALAWLYLTLYLTVDRGMPAQQAGFVAALYGVGLLLGNLGGGHFGDRFGMRRCVLISLTLWAVLCALMPVVPNPGLPVIGGCAGLFVGAVRPLSSALVAAALPADRRREGIALSRTASNAGFMIGPPIGGLLASINFDLLFIVDSASSLILACLLWTKVPAVAVAGAHAQRGGMLRTLRHQPQVITLLAAVVLIDTVYRQVYSSLPLLLRDKGSPPAAYGALITVNAVVIVLAEAPLAVALRRHRALLVISAGFGFVALGFATIAVWPALAGAVLAMVVITIGEMLYKPTATAHVIDAAPEGMTGRYSSLYAAASISGMALAPALGGTAYQYLPNLLWPLAALVAAGAATVVWFAAVAAPAREGAGLS